MTDEMLALARENQRKAGVENVEFLKGEIENIPLPDNSVDVIISNCVINLSADKDQVLREAFRVLKPGGRFAVSDVVLRGDIPPSTREHDALGGLHRRSAAGFRVRSKLARAGFEAIDIEPTRIYRIEDARAFLPAEGIDVDAIAPQVEGKFISAFVRATKPKQACMRPRLLGLKCGLNMQEHSFERLYLTLQRSVLVHGQLGAVDHGRGHHEFPRHAPFQGIQRGQPSHRRSPAGSGAPDREREHADAGIAQQELGRIR